MFVHHFIDTEMFGGRVRCTACFNAWSYQRIKEKGWDVVINSACFGVLQ